MAESDLLEIAGVTSGRMCVNSEWGCLGDDGALDNVLTPYSNTLKFPSGSAFVLPIKYFKRHLHYERCPSAIFLVKPTKTAL